MLVNKSNMEIVEESLVPLKQKFQHSSAAVIITDVEGKIEYVNTQFEKRTGYSSEEVLGKNPRIINSGQTNPLKYKNLWKTITSGKNWSGEFENKKKTGEPFWEYSTIYPIFNENKKITHFLAIKEDITAIKNVDREIEKEEIKRKMSIALKYNFLKRISHEIRTPANIIVSFADLCDEYIYSKKKENLSHYIAILKDLNNGIVETIDFLLYISEKKPYKETSNFKILHQEFLVELENSIKIPAQTILGIALTLKSKCNTKYEDDLSSLFKIMITSCNRVISTIDTILDCSKRTNDDIKFIRGVTDKIDSVKESYEGEANQKIFQFPSSNIPNSFGKRMVDEKEVEKILDDSNHKVIENEWTNELLNQEPISSNNYDYEIDSNYLPEVNYKYNSLFQLNRNNLIELKKTDDVYVVFIKHTRVDYSVTNLLEKFLKKNLIGVKKKIILDFNLTQKIYICFWGLLIKLIREHEFNASNIYLVLKLGEQPNTVISAHVDEIFSVFSTLQDAIASAKSERDVLKRGA